MNESSWMHVRYDMFYGKHTSMCMSVRCCGSPGSHVHISNVDDFAWPLIEIRRNCVLLTLHLLYPFFLSEPSAALTTSSASLERHAWTRRSETKWRSSRASAAANDMFSWSHTQGLHRRLVTCSRMLQTNAFAAVMYDFLRLPRTYSRNRWHNHKITYTNTCRMSEPPLQRVMCILNVLLKIFNTRCIK